MSLAATATPYRSGESATWNMDSPVFKMLCGLVDHGAFPPDEQLEVLTLASSTTAEHDCVASQWSLDDLAIELVNRHAAEAMSRSTIQRILHQADLKPHRSVYWLNSHDPDFDAKAKDICRLYIKAPALYQQGELVICCDEKTGMQILQRKYPTISAQPGKPENASTSTSATAPGP
jgi:hypothetical protein